MQEIYLDIIKILFSVVIGAILGLERRKAGKPAGLRTLSLVSAGSTLAVISILNAFPDDTSRVIQGIITGIGFLGGGAIVFSHQNVHGLTTAASIWATAIIGIAIGLGEFVLAFAFAVIAFIVLEMGKVERTLVEKINRKSK